MNRCRIAVVGAGVGGLVAALELASRGHEVTVFERHAKPGGKLRQLAAAGRMVDAGPTVFTMKWVFDKIFEDAGSRLADEITVHPLTCLARHAWSEHERLDLFSSIGETADAIGRFAGRAEAEGYRDFCARAQSVYRTLEGPFIRSSQPTPISLALGAGLSGFGDLWRISPFSTLWSALGDHFRDPRLRQLFGRYATYCGSSPFQAPATLMLVAHVEQAGVWTIEGGMYRLIEALARLAEKQGVTIRCEADVNDIEAALGRVTGIHLASGERVGCDGIVFNGDANAIASGLLGVDAAPAVELTMPSARSLSAITWTMLAKSDGFPLEHHNVFFSRDYEAEFDTISARSELPEEPTVYICAQDRARAALARPDGPERLLMLVNAPACGDRHHFTPSEIETCQARALALLKRCGLRLAIEEAAVESTSPTDFAKLFPATGGALYGRASHGWTASFDRPQARTPIPGLYLAGGSVHPGPGVPMAAISGWIAAASLMADLDSRTRSRPVAMSGGTSMR